MGATAEGTGVADTVTPGFPVGAGRFEGKKCCQAKRTAMDRTTARSVRFVSMSMFLMGKLLGGAKVIGYRVPPSRMKRMASKQAPRRQPRPPPKTVSLVSLNGVGAAAWVEPAGRGRKR